MRRIFVQKYLICLQVDVQRTQKGKPRKRGGKVGRGHEIGRGADKE